MFKLEECIWAKPFKVKIAVQCFKASLVKVKNRLVAIHGKSVIGLGYILYVKNTSVLILTELF